MIICLRKKNGPLQITARVLIVIKHRFRTKSTFYYDDESLIGVLRASPADTKFHVKKVLLKIRNMHFFKNILL
jgi:hypothetical protein